MLKSAWIAGVALIGAAASVHAQASFGRAVVVGDGEVIVGEPATNNAFRSGVVYVYRKSGNTWREALKLTAPDAQRADGFGSPLALNGSTLFVGQGERFHIFRKQANGNWTHAGTISPTSPPPSFGASVASAGDWLFIGAPGRPPGGRRGGAGGIQGQQAEPGMVLVFRRQGEQWREVARLNAPDASPGDAFGADIALTDGYALIGAPAKNDRAGVVYPFRLDAASGQWQAQTAMQSPEPQANEAFGSSIALRGDRLVIGAPLAGGNYGTAFVYKRDPATGEWVEPTRLVAFTGARQQGFAAEIALGENDIWIATPTRSQRSGGAQRSPGGVFAYRIDANGAVETARLVLPSDLEPDDRFGSALALNANVAAVAALGADHGAGTVTIFERDRSGEWRQSAEVFSPPDAMQPLVGEERRCSAEGKVGVFSCGEAELLAYLPVSSIAIDPRGVRLNDIWGWTDPQTNREYALVGRIEGTAFVDVTDPTKPLFIGELPKTPGVPDGTWRDIKVYRDHAFIVADGAGAHGMQVFDLRQLRGLNGNPPRSFTPTAHYTRINSSHNIVINEESGFAYAVGASAGGETCGGGLHMIDIRDPRNPQFAGCFADPQTGRRGTGYTHDAQCVIYKGPDQRYRGREICLGSNETALSIADVTDKRNPRAISRAAYPNPAYTHQGWLTEDHRYFFMDDEGDEIAGTVDRTRTLVWDLTDLEDPKLVNEFMGTSGASDHNLYVRGNLMFQSNYRAGLRIIDITDPLRPAEVGYFDTAPYLEDAPGFSGTWSNYPYFRSGAVAVSSVHEGLFLVKKRPPRPVS